MLEYANLLIEIMDWSKRRKYIPIDSKIEEKDINEIIMSSGIKEGHINIVYNDNERSSISPYTNQFINEYKLDYEGREFYETDYDNRRIIWKYVLYGLISNLKGYKFEVKYAKEKKIDMDSKICELEAKSALTLYNILGKIAFEDINRKVTAKTTVDEIYQIIDNIKIRKGNLTYKPQVK